MRFWMDGANRLAPGTAYRRVVRLRDGAVLNRYFDDIPEPRPESYREDYALAQTVPAAQRVALYRNLRASAESGWDFSSRWMRDPTDLRTLETIELLPVDLNSLTVSRRADDCRAAAAARGGPATRRSRRDSPPRPRARRRALLAAAYDPAAGLLLRRALAHRRAGDRSADARRGGAALLRPGDGGAGPRRRRAARARLPQARRIRDHARRLGAAVGRAERMAAAAVAGDRGRTAIRPRRFRRPGTRRAGSPSTAGPTTLRAR